MDASLTSENVMTLKVSELKSALTERGLETNGVKATLQKRLIEALGSASAGMEVDAAPKGPEYEVDESTRYSGTVVRYFKRKGFGQICPEGKDATSKDDLIFVHWKQIQSSDEWPALQKDQKVEFYLATRPGEKNKKKVGRKYAANVTLEGGLQVVFADDRVFPDRSQRFAGTIEFMDPKKGFGFIKPKADFNFNEQDFSASKKGSIYIAREDIKTVDGFEKSPAIKGGTEVEFTLYKRKEGANYGAADITKPGGVPFEADDLWLRKPFDPTQPRRKRSKKGKKRKANQMNMTFSKKQLKQLQKAMKGMMMPMGGMPMMMGGGMNMMMGGAQPQMMMINGQPFMVMGGAQGGRKKKRRKNNKKKNKN